MFLNSLKNAARNIETRYLAYSLARRHNSFEERGFPNIRCLAFDYVARNIVINGRYENDELQALMRWFQHSGLDASRMAALDIGANVGNHSLFFARYFRTVTAYEPRGDTFSLLNLNTGGLANVHTRNVGLSSTAGEAWMKVPAGNTGGAHLVQGEVSAAGEVHERVELTTVDLEFPGVSVGLMKLDVEGHELSVLLGACDTIRLNSPLILFEHRGPFRNSLVVEFLRNEGYDAFYAPKRVLGNLDADRLPRLLRVFCSEMEMRVIDEESEVDIPFVLAVPRTISGDLPHA